MMTSLKVQQILKRAGSTGQLQSKSMGVYSPVSGTKPTNTSTSYDLFAVQLQDRRSFAAESPFRTAEIVLYASCSTRPKSGDTVTWAGVARIIKHEESLDPTGVGALLYIIALSAA